MGSNGLKNQAKTESGGGFQESGWFLKGTASKENSKSPSPPKTISTDKKRITSHDVTSHHPHHYQAFWRERVVALRRARLLAATVALQSGARGFLARARCRKERAARSLQAAARGRAARKRYGEALKEQAELRAREEARQAEEMRCA